MNNTRIFTLTCAVLLMGLLPPAFGVTTYVIDFEDLPDGKLMDGYEFNGHVTVTSNTPLGSAIYNTNKTTGADPDLHVGKGNALILQSNVNSNTSVIEYDGKSHTVYDTPNDKSSGGTITFTFNLSVFMESVTLIDIDKDAETTITLTDKYGRTRTYTIPEYWTYDKDAGDNENDDSIKGYKVLDLTTLEDQAGETGADPDNTTAIAKAIEQDGFSAANVRVMTVEFSGSGAIDDITYIPAPGAILLGSLGAGLAGWLRRRRSI